MSDEPAEVCELLALREIRWELSTELLQLLEGQFKRYDIELSGKLNLEDLQPISTHVAYLLGSEPFGIQVKTAQIDRLVAIATRWLNESEPSGLSRVPFINLVVFTFELPHRCFIGRSGRFNLERADLGSHVTVSGSNRRRNAVSENKKFESTWEATAGEKGGSDGNPELTGSSLREFLDWWELQYSKEELEEHYGLGPNGYDTEVESILVQAKVEFKATSVRKAWEIDRAANFKEWRRCIRDRLDDSQCKQTEQNLVLEIHKAKAVEKKEHVARILIGKSIWWVEGTTFVSEEALIWKLSNVIRTHRLWQPFMLGVNLINVIGLMSSETSCDPGDCDNVYQDHVLPALDVTTNVLFTLDMLTAMIVLGFASYFANSFNKLDFFVVLQGWINSFAVGIDLSALRALRVLRPLRMIKYFKAIQSIGGAIYFNLDPLLNVLQFMVFFIVIFGIAGISLFPGKLQQRCVVSGAYGSQTGMFAVLLQS